MPDKRYCSGTSMTRTTKEIILDRIEQCLGDFDDATYLDMKKLTVTTLKALDKTIDDIATTLKAIDKTLDVPCVRNS